MEEALAGVRSPDCARPCRTSVIAKILPKARREPSSRYLAMIDKPPVCRLFGDTPSDRLRQVKNVGCELCERAATVAETVTVAFPEEARLRRALYLANPCSGLTARKHVRTRSKLHAAASGKLRFGGSAVELVRQAPLNHSRGAGTSRNREKQRVSPGIGFALG